MRLSKDAIRALIMMFLKIHKEHWHNLQKVKYIKLSVYKKLGVLNDGYDNTESDYILKVNDKII